MKELIMQALNEALLAAERTIPQTKPKTESVSIIDVNPLDIPSFMRDNNIPDNAYFSGRDNGYDAWDDILLSWEIQVPTTEGDKMKFLRRKFTHLAFKCVYDKLTHNGYKRVGYNTGLLKEFDDTTVYDMFINADFDRLVKYYSLPFVLNL